MVKHAKVIYKDLKNVNSFLFSNLIQEKAEEGIYCIGSWCNGDIIEIFFGEPPKNDLEEVKSAEIVTAYPFSEDLMKFEVTPYSDIIYIQDGLLTEEYYDYIDNECNIYIFNGYGRIKKWIIN